MKKLIIALLICCNAALYGQNLVHYAFDTNGPLGECLFPQDAKGQVSYSGVVEVNGSASEIMAVLLDYIASQNVDSGYDLKEQAKSPRSILYTVKCSVGKQLREVTVMGSPVFSALKDASDISFKCLLEVIDGKFKYTLKDFLTKRNTLRGAAKNDGDPNLIHWQRVNSLTREKNEYALKHNANKRSTREVLYDYDSQIEFEKNLYVLEHDAVSRFVEGLKRVSLLANKDMFESDIQPERFEIKSDSGIPMFSLDGFKGNLLAKGNNVFISGDALYEVAGAKELIKQISIDSLWIVVPRPEQAHFIIEYHVDTSGKDKAYIVVRSKDGTASYKSLKYPASESFEDNRSTAKLVYKNLKYKVTRVWDGKNDKDLSKFIIQ